MRRFVLCTMVAAACSPETERLDAYMREREAAGFSGALVVYRNGEITFNGGYGFANQARGLHNTAETVFPLGSNVKDLTRAVILELELDGRLRRDQTLAEFFQDAPADKRSITLDQLLRHASGLRPYHGERQPGVPADHVQLSRDSALALILSQELLFEPGTGYAYSNSGYTLLAMVVENVTAMPFIEAMDSLFVVPAGLVNTGFYRDPRWEPDDVAVGYGPVTYGEENSPVYWPTNAWPVAGNGGMAGPPADLLSAIRYIDARRRASAEFDQAWRATSPGDQPADMYGGAGGNDFGFVSVVFFWPARDDGLVLVTNNDDDGAEDQQLLVDILQLALGVTPADLGGGSSDDAGGPANRAGADDLPSPVGDWGLPDRGTWRRIGLVFDALAAGDTASLVGLVDQGFTPRFRAMVPIAEHLRELLAIRAAVVPIDLTGAERESQQFLLQLRGAEGASYVLSIDLEGGAPFRVDALDLTRNRSPD